MINELTTDGRVVEGLFQVALAERKISQSNKPYYSLKLRDKTGECWAKLWDIPDALKLASGMFVKVRAVCESYKEELQLRILKIRLLAPEEIVIDDYLPASKRNRQEMLNEIVDIAASIEDSKLRSVLLTIFSSDVASLFKDAPAARKNHQAYLGGLAEHTLTMCALAQAVCSVYPALNRDVLMAGVLLHDIGKCWELEYRTQIAYTRLGATVGHITLGVQLWGKYEDKLDAAAYEHILHLILSHHGKREWGSPVEPATREANVLHLIDMMDSRYEMYTGALDGNLDKDGLTGFNSALGTQIWNGK